MSRIHLFADPPRSTSSSTAAHSSSSICSAISSSRAGSVRRSAMTSPGLRPRSVRASRCWRRPAASACSSFIPEKAIGPTLPTPPRTRSTAAIPQCASALRARWVFPAPHPQSLRASMYPHRPQQPQLERQDRAGHHPDREQREHDPRPPPRQRRGKARPRCAGTATRRTARAPETRYRSTPAVYARQRERLHLPRLVQIVLIHVHTSDPTPCTTSRSRWGPANPKTKGQRRDPSARTGSLLRLAAFHGPEPAVGAVARRVPLGRPSPAQRHTQDPPRQTASPIRECRALARHDIPGYFMK